MDREGVSRDRGSAIAYPGRQGRTGDPAANLGVLRGGSTKVAGGSHRSVDFGPSALTEVPSVEGKREDGAANHADHHHPAKKGRRKPNIGAKVERDLPPGGGRGGGIAPANESSPARTRARARALAGASAAASATAAVDSMDRAGSNLGSSRVDERFITGGSAGDGAAAAKPQGSADASAAGRLQPQSTGGTGGKAVLPRRKPSEERAGEPRAVFVHRASIENLSAGAGTAAVEAARASTVAEDLGVGGGGGARRLSSKGRVGSVLPT